jgi:hypothetical protein
VFLFSFSPGGFFEAVPSFPSRPPRVSVRDISAPKANHALTSIARAPSANRCENSTVVAHEKAFNQMRSPRARLARLNQLDDDRKEQDATALKIDQAEVDFGKREAQLRATSVRLKEKAASFLDVWTPKVENTLRGLNFAQRDALHADSQAFGEGCLVHDDCDGSLEAARLKCRAYLADVLDNSVDATEADGTVAPHTTPEPSSVDVANQQRSSGASDRKGKAKAAAA